MYQVYVDGTKYGYYRRGGKSFEVKDCNATEVRVILAKEGDPLKGAIQGKVVDTDTGKVIPDVQVEVTDGETTTSVQTGSGGEYTITDLSSEKAWTQSFAKQGYHTTKKTGVEVKPGESTYGDALLVPKAPGKGAVAGRVVDGSGKPLAGVPVELNRMVTSNGYSYSPEKTASATTDANGEFTFPGLTPGPYDLFVNGKAKGLYNTGSFTYEIKDCNTQIVEFILAKQGDPLKGAVQGKVVDSETGKVIPDVKVEVSDGETTKSVQTGSGGEYTIPDLSPEKAWTQVVSKQGYHTTTKSGVEVKEDEITIADNRLVGKTEGKGAVIGRVVNGSNAPLSGVKVDLSRIVSLGSGTSQSEDVGSTTTDPDGNFNFPGLDPGVYAIYVDGSKYGYYSSGGYNREVKNCTAAVYTVVMAREGDPLKGGITGTVVDTYTGKTIPNATVSATQNSSSKPSDAAMKQGAAFATTVTDRNGNYFFSDLPVDATYNLTVSGEGIYTSVLGTVAVEKGIAYVTPQIGRAHV